MKNKKLMLVLLLGLLVPLGADSVAQAAGRREIRRDIRELRQDRRELKRELRHYRRELKRDLRSCRRIH
jgi:hypothetical protein